MQNGIGIDSLVNTRPAFSPYGVTAGGRVIYMVKLKGTDLFYVGVLLFHKSTWVAITCDGLLHFIVKSSFSTWSVVTGNERYLPGQKQEANKHKTKSQPPPQ